MNINTRLSKLEARIITARNPDKPYTRDDWDGLALALYFDPTPEMLEKAMLTDWTKGGSKRKLEDFF